MTDQMSFISCRWPRSKPPKRADVLNLIERVLPWDEIESRLRPHYESDKRKTGRRGFSLRMMIRCWVVACIWNLSDEALENAILDSLTIAKFVGTDPWSPRPPSASAFRNFRHFVGKVMTGSDLRLDIDLAMIKSGIQWRQGCIVEPVFRRQPGRARG